MAYDFNFLDPYAMLAGIPNWLVQEWEYWYIHHHLVGNTLDPEFRGDVRAAKGFMYLVNAWNDGKAFTIEDLMAFPPPKPTQSDEQLQKSLEARADAQSKQPPKKVEAKETVPGGKTNSRTPNKTGSRPGRSSQGSHRRVKEPRGSE